MASNFGSPGQFAVFTPMELNEDLLDLFDVHDAGLVADGINADVKMP